MEKRNCCELRPSRKKCCCVRNRCPGTKPSGERNEQLYIIQQCRPKRKNESALARKRAVNNLNEWYFEHIMKMRSSALMKSFVKRMQEGNNNVDCKELNKFFLQDKSALYGPQAEDNLGKLCKDHFKAAESPPKPNSKISNRVPQQNRCQNNRMDNTINAEKDDSFFEVYKRLADEALAAYDKGLYSKKKSVKELMEKLRKARAKSKERKTPNGRTRSITLPPSRP